MACNHLDSISSTDSQMDVAVQVTLSLMAASRWIWNMRLPYRQSTCDPCQTIPDNGPDNPFQQVVTTVVSSRRLLTSSVGEVPQSFQEPHATPDHGHVTVEKSKRILKTTLHPITAFTPPHDTSRHTAPSPFQTTRLTTSQ